MDPKLGPLNNKDKIAVLTKKLGEVSQDFYDMQKLANLYKARIGELEEQTKFHAEKAALVEKILDTVFPDWRDEKAWKMLDEEPEPAPEETVEPELEASSASS